ncbi:hypothetical protein BKA93DRAFT_814049 [Sparassis latifolia]
MSQNVRQRGSAVKSSSDLPPPRDRKKATAPISPPLSRVPLHRFVYYLALFAVIVSAFYTWRLFQWKAKVGGWWNLALGRRPPGMQSQGVSWPGGVAPTSTPPPSGGHASVEQRINELAAALGIASKDLASAIASAVREHVPPASLSSTAAHETGDAVQYLINPTSASASETESDPGTPASRGIIKTVASAFEAVVGLDDSLNDLDGQ